LGGRDRGRRIFEFEASLVYKVSSRTARATQRNPVSEKKKKKEKKRIQKKEEKENAWKAYTHHMNTKLDNIICKQINH
jgi:hypothetical protein